MMKARLILDLLSRNLTLQADAQNLPPDIAGFTYDFQQGYRRALADVAGEVRRLRMDTFTEDEMGALR